MNRRTFLATSPAFFAALALGAKTAGAYEVTGRHGNRVWLWDGKKTWRVERVDGGFTWCVQT